MSVFIDTSALFALLDASDVRHREAARIWAGLLDSEADLFTHSYVIVETSALVQRRMGEKLIEPFFDGLLPLVRIIWVEEEIHRRALRELGLQPDSILVDGRDGIPGVEVHQEAVIKGDKRCISIAAASIVAKVLRDSIMLRFHREAPAYGLANNKGYGTEDHYEALADLGPTSFHRRSFKLMIEPILF